MKSLRETKLMMGMPITVEIVDESADQEALDAVFAYFEHVDNTFSTYKDSSEISRINRRELRLSQASAEMQTIFDLAEKTKELTNGYFDIFHDGHYDPSGLVKGWAIYNAAELLRQRGYQNFYVDAGGDIEAAGKNMQGRNWRVGIRNPFNLREIVKVLALSDCGVATSGSYVRGRHIYNPITASSVEPDILSLTVVGPNIYDADRFATAAYAMGIDGIVFIENLDGFEGYQIDKNGMATFTSGFERHVSNDQIH